MLRPLLHALPALLLAMPLQAQPIRIAPSLTPANGAPAAAALAGPATLTPLVSPLSAPALAAPLSAPSLTPAFALSPTPVSPTAPAAALPAAAKPVLPYGIPGRARMPANFATPADGWARRFDFRPDARFFDGGRDLRSDDGAIFTAVPRDNGYVRVHIVESAPQAERRTVPGTEDLAGKTLLDALTAISARGHRTRSYEETSDFMFSKADQVVINGVRGVVDAYSGIFVPGTSKEGRDYREPGDVNGDGHSDRAGMNVEHTWPQSLFSKQLPERSDIHHLMTTFMHPNSIRGHLPFGIVTGVPDYQNKAGAKRGTDARGNYVFEPPDAVKGLVARRQIYFYTRHKNSRLFGRKAVVYWNQQIELFLNWNRAYPPDAVEARRNGFGQEWQSNRNPFIDDYLLADRIGAEAFRAGNPSRGQDARGLDSMRVRPFERRRSGHRFSRR